MQRHQLKLCLVTHVTTTPFNEYKKFLLQAISGGVTAIQLRDKTASRNALYRMAAELKELLSPLNIPLIINDHVDIAKAVNAEGVHLGQTDGSSQAAHDELGPDAFIGLSIETLDELDKANLMPWINYIGASAVFQSHTKTNCKTIWGLDGLRALVLKSIHPVVAIGGINEHNIQKTMACGVCGVAVIGAIHDAANPEYAARNLLGKHHV